LRLPKLGLGELRQQWRVLYKASGVFTFRACAAYSPATARRAPIVRAAS
jgi:hypothetical protein